MNSPTAADLSVLVLICALAGSALASLRWLRVAQREHYLPGAVSVFSWRWWRRTPLDAGAFAVGLAGAVVSVWVPAAALATAVVAAGAPLGLSLKGRTSRLVWTRRLATVAVAVTVLEAVVVAVGAAISGVEGAVVAAAVAALGVPAVIDLALLLLKPVERELAGRFVREAAAKLHEVNPVVVAITGSYGKTSTKGYVAHLIGADRDVLASPASYNNRAGLSRTVNEHLRPEVQVLVAEMGTYGEGEIDELCRWMTPSIAVITAIGPAHLERFKSLDRTLAAKAEIAEHAAVVVLNVDDERLAGLADRVQAAGKRVVRASGVDPHAAVAVVAARDGIELRVADKRVGVAATGSERPPSQSNAACAAAVALELGLAAESVLARLANLPVPPNRLQRYTAERGYVVLDDTFNSNPAGARIALGRLAHEPAARRVVVTPGMIELGPTQFGENASFAETAARACTDVVVVARTNRRSLSAGVERATPKPNLVLVDRLDQAVEWVRRELGPGDVVLYENDLPDHFP